MERDREEYIPLGKCVKGKVYLLDSRNLGVGAYDGKEGFVGIRTKFGDRYLFTEYHHDQGPPHGTAFPLRELADLPPGVVPEDSLGTVDGVTGRQLVWMEDERLDKHWHYADTKELAPRWPEWRAKTLWQPGGHLSLKSVIGD